MELRELEKAGEGTGLRGGRGSEAGDMGMGGKRQSTEQDGKEDSLRRLGAESRAGSRGPGY